MNQLPQAPLRRGQVKPPPLPEARTSVDVTIDGETEHLGVDRLGTHTITIGKPEAVRHGSRALFNYAVAGGRYQFVADCTSVDFLTATFGLPATVTTIERPGTTRNNYRFPLGIAIRWRPAAGGTGAGSFAPGTVADISYGGAALTLRSAPTEGSQIELQLKLDGETLALIGTVVRLAPIGAVPGYSVGLKFNGVRPFQANTILDFVRKKRSAAENRKG